MSIEFNGRLVIDAGVQVRPAVAYSSQKVLVRRPPHRPTVSPRAYTHNTLHLSVYALLLSVLSIDQCFHGNVKGREVSKYRQWPLALC